MFEEVRAELRDQSVSSEMVEKLDAQLYKGTAHLLNMQRRKPALASFHRGSGQLKLNRKAVNSIINMFAEVRTELHKLDSLIGQEIALLYRPQQHQHHGAQFHQLPTAHQSYGTPVQQPMQGNDYGSQRVSTDIKLPKVMIQQGQICKPTALANLDYYYSDLHKVPNIPLNKNSKGLFANQLNEHAANSVATNSIRKIAKQHGSLQGEVLQADLLEKIVQDMGYSAKSLTPTNLQEFTDHVANELQKNHPLLVCFSVVNRIDNKEQGLKLGHPNPYTSNGGKTEHACLITGFNAQNNTVTIAHWGKTYSNIPIDHLYRSMKS